MAKKRILTKGRVRIRIRQCFGSMSVVEWLLGSEARPMDSMK